MWRTIRAPFRSGGVNSTSADFRFRNRGEAVDTSFLCSSDSRPGGVREVFPAPVSEIRRASTCKGTDEPGRFVSLLHEARSRSDDAFVFEACELFILDSQFTLKDFPVVLSESRWR